MVLDKAVDVDAGMNVAVLIMVVRLVLDFTVAAGGDVDVTCFPFGFVCTIYVGNGSWYCCGSLMLMLMLVLPDWPSIADFL